MNDITIIEHQGQRVLTTRQVAKHYTTTANRLRDNYNENKKRFIEGNAYFLLEGSELQGFKDYIGNSDLVPKNAPSLYLWTEKGCFLHAKSLNTDKAWDVYESLVDHYFRSRELFQKLNRESEKYSSGQVQETALTKLVNETLQEYNQRIITLERRMDLDELELVDPDRPLPAIGATPVKTYSKTGRQYPPIKILQLPDHIRDVVDRMLRAGRTLRETTDYLKERGYIISVKSVHRYKQALFQTQPQDASSKQTPVEFQPTPVVNVTSSGRKRWGKMFGLPCQIRDVVDRMIQSGCTYQEITNYLNERNYQVSLPSVALYGKELMGYRR